MLSFYIIISMFFSVPKSTNIWPPTPHLPALLLSGLSWKIKLLHVDYVELQLHVSVSLHAQAAESCPETIRFDKTTNVQLRESTYHMWSNNCDPQDSSKDTVLFQNSSDLVSNWGWTGGISAWSMYPDRGRSGSEAIWTMFPAGTSMVLQ